MVPVNMAVITVLLQFVSDLAPFGSVVTFEPSQTLFLRVVKYHI